MRVGKNSGYAKDYLISKQYNCFLGRMYEQENNPEALEGFLQLSDLETFMYSVKGDTLYYSNDEVTTIDLDTMEVFYG